MRRTYGCATYTNLYLYICILQAREAHRRLRNTCRFLLGNLHDFGPDDGGRLAHGADPAAAAGLRQFDRYDFNPYSPIQPLTTPYNPLQPLTTPFRFDRYVLHRLVRYAAAAEEGCASTDTCYMHTRHVYVCMRARADTSRSPPTA